MRWTSSRVEITVSYVNDFLIRISRCLISFKSLRWKSDAREVTIAVLIARILPQLPVCRVNDLLNVVLLMSFIDNDVNTLIRVLKLVSREDIHLLQLGVQHIASVYSYYRFNRSMTSIPTSMHVLPDGDAINMLG